MANIVYSAALSRTCFPLIYILEPKADPDNIYNDI